jgi:DNA polymerase I
VSEGYEFCNAARSGDAVVAIGLSDSTGWTEVLYGKPKDEKKLLTDFVKTVRQRDPDVIEGHNIFNFDLSYLRARAKRHRVALALGRNGSEPRFRSSRLSVAERTIAYTRCGILGRHVVDTLFLSQAYDVSERSLEGLGLKQVAAHFGLTARGRTYVAGSEITKTFRENPEKVVAYVRDDAVETGAISAVLSQSYFVQAQMLPYSYQDVCVRGNASKIDALMVREYMRTCTIAT